MTRKKYFQLTYVVIGLLALSIVGRVIHLQLDDWTRDHNVSLSDQIRIEETVVPKRGSLFDRHGFPLAKSVSRWDLFVDPNFLRLQLQDVKPVVRALAEHCGLNPEGVSQTLAQNKRFAVLKKDLSYSEVEWVKQARIPGLRISENQKRVYPEGPRTAHVIGFVERTNNRGLEGLEYLLNQELQGSAGKKFTRVDVSRETLAPPQVTQAVEHGFDYPLTLDVEIQRIVDRALQDAFAQWQPRFALALVMDPFSGALYASSQVPSFNPSKILKEDLEAIPGDLNRLANRAVSYCWEPGSLLKPIVWTAALEEKIFKLKDQIYCEPNGWRLPGRILHDHRPNGWLSVEDILVKSSNVGMAKMTKRLVSSSQSPEHLFNWLKKFGFGEKTGVDLPGEIAGIFKPVDQWERTTWASLPMGHEIAVTPLQYLRAFNVFATGGLLVDPHVNYGRREEPTRILSEDISNQTARVLLEVVKRGTGKRAQIGGLEVCGKTGTTQKLVPEIDENGKKKFVYSHEKYTSSFAAFAPLVNPKLSVLVILDEPQGSPEPFGSVVCAPVAREIIEKTLNYLEVNAPIYKDLRSP